MRLSPFGEEEEEEEADNIREIGVVNPNKGFETQKGFYLENELGCKFNAELMKRREKEREF